jgi:hypothetical protein
VRNLCRKKKNPPEDIMTNTAHTQASELLRALKVMREAYGTFHAGNCYIRTDYANELAAANAFADAAIAKAEGSPIVIDEAIPASPNAPEGASEERSNACPRLGQSSTSE